jgi:hypothetical protein
MAESDVYKPATGVSTAQSHGRESDLYKFDPRDWTDEIESYTEVTVHDQQNKAVVLTLRRLESAGSTDWPRQVESDAIQHYKTVHWAEEINVEHLEKSMGDAIIEVRKL